jgi:hypothetical protein
VNKQPIDAIRSPSALPADRSHEPAPRSLAGQSLRSPETSLKRKSPSGGSNPSSSQAVSPPPRKKLRGETYSSDAALSPDGVAGPANPRWRVLFDFYRQFRSVEAATADANAVFRHEVGPQAQQADPQSAEQPARAPFAQSMWHGPSNPWQRVCPLGGYPGGGVFGRMQEWPIPNDERLDDQS